MELDHSIETITPNSASTITFAGTGGIVLPIGTTAQRPTGIAGLLRLNSDLGGVLETYNSTLSAFIPATSVGGVATAVAAAGTTQGTATALSPGYNNVTSSSAGTATGVILPTTATGITVTVRNNTGNGINVYPSTGHTIDSTGVNVPLSIMIGGVVTFTAVQSGEWSTSVNMVQNLARVSGTLPLSNGGSGQTSLGSPLQVLRTNAAGNATEWATNSGGGTSLVAGYVTISCGAAAAQSSAFVSVPTILATTTITLSKSISASIDKTADEHLVEGWEVVGTAIVPTSGFYVYIKSTNQAALGGTFNVSYMLV
jgi:hypothetical protein